ncbi:VC0807 family protein [Kibdelosporangium aridum]|uniref:Intracellular septation protein A n=1 Tax=Kibdelosporangium aridum TaxID=2030 RepID=A0A1W2FBT4_KIBAR|nr:VC0807 family protein [Kibdelosporangium aridum]SMD19016.1 Intracellular septation protein A [Kibdelosporangium aridum]
MANKAIKTLVPILLKDILPPVAIYYVLNAAGANDWIALLGGTVVSAGLLVTDAVRSRRLDPFSGFMLTIFGLGLIAAVAFNDPKFVILKASLMTGIIGAAFLISCVVGKPLTYLAYRRAVGGNIGQEHDGLMRLLSVVWGTGLLAEAIVRAVLAYQLAVSTMVGLSTVLSIGTIALLLLITVQVAKRARAKRSGQRMINSVHSS